MLYDRLDRLQLECRERLVRWFAYHLSNFQFLWTWADWIETLPTLPAGSADPATHPVLDQPKTSFIRHVLLRCLRCALLFLLSSLLMCFVLLCYVSSPSACGKVLMHSNECSARFDSNPCRFSYHQRLVDMLPKGCEALLPANPVAFCKYDEESGGMCNYEFRLHNSTLNEFTFSKVLYL